MNANGREYRISSIRVNWRSFAVLSFFVSGQSVANGTPKNSSPPQEMASDVRLRIREVFFGCSLGTGVLFAGRTLSSIFVERRQRQLTDDVVAVGP